MAGLYYEEFSVGQEFLHPWTRTTFRNGIIRKHL